MTNSVYNGYVVAWRWTSLKDYVIFILISPLLLLYVIYYF